MASLAGTLGRRIVGAVHASGLALALGMAGLTGCDQGQDQKPEPKDKKESPANVQPSQPGKSEPGSGPEKKAPEKKEPEKAGPETVSMAVGSKTFKLELALDDTVRTKGLGQRDKISEDGGMLFCFKETERRAFVMRDCPVDIDIIYVDGAGRIVSMHQMKAEPPRGEGEGKVGDFRNKKYEDRLKPYDSKFGCQFVIELKGGTIPSLGLKVNDKVAYDWDSLKKRAK